MSAHRHDGDPNGGFLRVLQVADTGVAMGLLPSTMAGGTEGLASPSTVAMTWAPSSLWLSAQDMVRSQLFH